MEIIVKFCHAGTSPQQLDNYYFLYITKDIKGNNTVKKNIAIWATCVSTYVVVMLRKIFVIMDYHFLSWNILNTPKSILELEIFRNIHETYFITLYLQWLKDILRLSLLWNLYRVKSSTLSLHLSYKVICLWWNNYHLGNLVDW